MIFTETSNPIQGKKVIVVLGPLELGGAERQALMLARFLKDEEGADVEIWGTSGRPGCVSAICDEHGIAWRIVPDPWGAGRSDRPKHLLAFARTLRRARPDVVLPYMAVPNVVCGLAWRSSGAQLCVWNQRDDGAARVGGRYERLAVKFTPRFVSNSAHGADHLVRALGVPASRVRVIPNGVALAPAQATRREWRDRLGVADDTFVAVMLGNLTRYKDHLTLIRAWAIALKSFKRESVLLLAGRLDETHEAAKALCYDLDLGRAVRFLGQVPDVSGLLAASDLGVFCSNSEGSPNAVLEYMAAGLAVCGTDIPAMREVLPEESHACLASPRDPEGLSRRILDLARDAVARARMGARNRARAEQDYTPRAMCERTLEVIRGRFLPPLVEPAYQGGHARRVITRRGRATP